MGNFTFNTCVVVFIYTG